MQRIAEFCTGRIEGRSGPGVQEVTRDGLRMKSLGITSGHLSSRGSRMVLGPRKRFSGKGLGAQRLGTIGSTMDDPRAPRKHYPNRSNGPVSLGAADRQLEEALSRFLRRGVRCLGLPLQIHSRGRRV